MTRSTTSFKLSVYGALLVAAAAALLCLWRAWCEYPIYAWNEARLAPAFAMRHGINPYPLIGEGPLSTWIYGPAGILINLPATFATSALGALQIASLINFLVLIVPLAWVFFQSHELQKQGAARRWFALVLAVLLIPRPNLVLQVADHTAFASGIFSCWFLTRAACPPGRDLACAAMAAIIAIWAKQIEAFLVIGQFVYLLLSSDRSIAIKYLLWLAAFGLLTLALIIGYFGWSNLWLNLVIIPGRLPWVADIADRLGMRPLALIGQIVLPCLALVGLRFTPHWPRHGDGPCSRFLRMAILAYCVMLPVGIAGFLKVGGDTNLFHSWDYLLPGVLLAWLASDKIGGQTQSYLPITITLFCLVLRRDDLRSVPSGPFASHFESADQLMAAHPHRIWFPRNPLITFYADGRLWHSEDGMETRFLADYGIRQADFRRHLAPDLEGVAYPSRVTTPFSLSLLPELNQTTRYSFWTLHTRAEPAVKP